MDTPLWPSSVLLSVVPHATTNLTSIARQLYVGVGGDVTVCTQNDVVLTFKNVGSGSTIGPFFIKRVNAIGTTATDMIAFV